MTTVETISCNSVEQKISRQQYLWFSHISFISSLLSHIFHCFTTENTYGRNNHEKTTVGWIMIKRTFLCMSRERSERRWNLLKVIFIFKWKYLECPLAVEILYDSLYERRNNQSWKSDSKTMMLWVNQIFENHLSNSVSRLLMWRNMYWWEGVRRRDEGCKSIRLIIIRDSESRSFV